MAERMDANELKTFERLEQVETRLLTEFQKWAQTTVGRLRMYEYGSISLSERMLAVKEKVREIDRRTGGKSI